MKILELFSGTHSIGRVCKEYNYEVISLDRDLGGTSKIYKDYDNTAHHIKEDIMTWDYKQFNEGEFDLITASPVCLFWSRLRNTWIGRKCKAINKDGSIVKKEDLERDINLYGKPMVDKVIEIIEYFKPKYWWIENPSTGKMKDYIEYKYPQYNTYYDFDYCKYTDWGYKKKTRFWTNIKDIKPLSCKNDCENMMVIGNQNLHSDRIGTRKTINDNRKIIRVNTKELREKYKDYKNIQSKKHKNCFGSKDKNQKCIGGGSSRLERYRIPESIIKELLDNII